MVNEKNIYIYVYIHLNFFSSQVDGNTDNKEVQENFIGTLMETMKGEHFPVHQEEAGDGDLNDGTNLQDLGRQPPLVTNPAEPRQNGYLPNNHNKDQGQNLRYDVRNMYAQMGSYPKDSVL